GGMTNESSIRWGCRGGVDFQTNSTTPSSATPNQFPTSNSQFPSCLGRFGSCVLGVCCGVGGCGVAELTKTPNQELSPLQTEYLQRTSNRAGMTQSDEELMAAVAAGDRDAFGALYRRRRPDVYRFALHMIGVPGAAEDVAQDVFMAVIHDARGEGAGRSPRVRGLLRSART